MVKVGELLDLGDPELETRLDESRRELFNLRFQLATGQLDNPSRIREVRRDVARILTVLREREIVAAEEEADVTEAPRAARRAVARRATAPAGSGASAEPSTPAAREPDGAGVTSGAQVADAGDGDLEEDA
jgi:large subunit ribosomal protein L29